MSECGRWEKENLFIVPTPGVTVQAWRWIDESGWWYWNGPWAVPLIIVLALGLLSSGKRRQP